MATLKLRPLGGGRPQHYRTRAFRHWIPAALLVCDRLLSLPEAHRFAALLGDVVPPGRGERQALGAAIWSTGGAAGQPLYDALVEKARFAATRGYHLGWWWQEGGEGAYFHPDGLLVVCGDRELRLASVPHPLASTLPGRVPGTTDAAAVEELVAARRARPLPDDEEPVAGRRADPELARFRDFRRAAREVRHMYLLARLFGRRVQSPHLHHRMQVPDTDVWRERAAYEMEK